MNRQPYNPEAPWLTATVLDALKVQEDREAEWLEDFFTGGQKLPRRTIVNPRKGRRK